MRARTTEEDGRIALIQSDIWIGFPRAEQVLDRLQGMIEAPRQTRMPGLLVHGASGIGKTMIARNLSRKYAPEYDPVSGITRTPLLLLQAPPAPGRTAVLPAHPGRCRRPGDGTERPRAKCGFTRSPCHRASARPWPAYDHDRRGSQPLGWDPPRTAPFSECSTVSQQ